MRPECFEVMTAATCDPRALSIAQSVHEREQPLATILFGSRARGDYEDRRSDIDIMLVQTEVPDGEYKGSVEEWAESVVRVAYGHRVPVQLVWLSEKGFNEGKRYINHVATQALFDGVIMTQNPDKYQNRDANDEEADYEYDWTPYGERLRHAEAHLLAFEQMIDLGNIDLLIGHQAQNSLEHAMKALLEAHSARHQRTHNIGDLLGRVRDVDPDLRQFQLSIPPDIYTQYAGEQMYLLTRRHPLLTDQPDYRQRTISDARRIINRAREVQQDRAD